MIVMNKQCFVVCIVGVVVMLFKPLHADRLHQEDGIMNNHSTEYVRLLNRNASTDPDAGF